MSSEPATIGGVEKPRRPLGVWEFPSLLLFGFATLMMTADYVGPEASPLRYLLGSAPWYITGLPWMAPAFVMAAWLAFRRWLGAWVPLLAYILFLYAAMGLVHVVTNQRLERVHLGEPLNPEQLTQLESAVGERVMQRSSNSGPRELVIRRDPQVHERVTRWMQEHGR